MHVYKTRTTHEYDARAAQSYGAPVVTKLCFQGYFINYDGTNELWYYLI